MNSLKKNASLPLVATLALTLTSFSTASAISPKDFGFRLIETSPGQMSWMEQSQLDLLSEIQHGIGRCGGYMDVTDTIETFNLLPDSPRPSIDFRNRPLRQEAQIETLLPKISKDQVQATVAQLSEGFVTRHYQSESGVKSAQWIADQYSLFAAGRKDVEIKLIPHNWKQPSVHVILHGTSLEKEHIVLGGHQDSISSFFDPNSRAPGADDDATGTATVLEVFRVLMLAQYKPSRTIDFFAYAAEERGLLGSQFIAQNFRANQVQVEAALQFDMTGFPGATKRKLYFINDFVDRDLTNWTQKLASHYLKIEWGEDPCGYACSDHASWTKNGYRSVFPFEATFDTHNKKIHTQSDTISGGALDFDFAVEFARLGLAFTLELGQD